MEFRKRVEGAILGAILGDCVANPYLFMRSEALQEKRNEIGWDVHEMSDESQLLILGLETVQNSGVRYDAFIRAYQSWVHGHPMDLDHVMCEVFGQSGTLQAKQLWHYAVTRDIGNLNSASLLVRQIPIVLSLWRESDEEALLEAIDGMTRLTHSDARTREICRLYALTLALVLRGESRVRIWDALQSKIQFSSTHEHVVNSYYYPPCLDQTDYSANHVTFQRVLYDLWHSHHFISSIRDCILSGGGTDMNASAVGAILGALWGRDGLPMPWIDALYHKYDTYIDDILLEAWKIARRSKHGALPKHPKPIRYSLGGSKRLSTPPSHTTPLQNPQPPYTNASRQLSTIPSFP